MAQRVLIAGAVSCEPDLLIADEPTTALDVTVQAEVLDLLRELCRRELNMGVILVTHNFGVVADLCDRVSVMRNGRIVEKRTGAQHLLPAAARVHPIAAGRHPRGGRAARTDVVGATLVRRRSDRVAGASLMTDLLLDAKDVVVEYPGKGFRASPFRALTDINSGHPAGRDRRPGRGVRFRQDHPRPCRAGPRPGHRRARSCTTARDIARLGPQGPPGLSSDIQVVFQDPYTSLNPSLTIEQILTEPLTVQGMSR